VNLASHLTKVFAFFEIVEVAVNMDQHHSITLSDIKLIKDPYKTAPSYMKVTVKKILPNPNTRLC